MLVHFPHRVLYAEPASIGARSHKLLWMSRVNLWYYSAVNGPPCCRASYIPGNDCSDSCVVCVCVCERARVASSDHETTSECVMWQWLWSGLQMQKNKIKFADSSTSSDAQTHTLGQSFALQPGSVEFWPLVYRSTLALYFLWRTTNTAIKKKQKEGI